MILPWIVKHREGWCVSLDHPESDQPATACRMVVVMPGGVRQGIPTCPECLAELRKAGGPLWARRGDLILPEGTSARDRAKFRKWYDRNGGCWGLYQHRISMEEERYRQWGPRAARNRPGSVLAPGVSRKVRRLFYKFRNAYGRCSFASWIAWRMKKGPHPLKILGREGVDKVQGI